MFTMVSRTVFLLEGVGERDGIPLGVHNREVRRLRRLRRPFEAFRTRNGGPVEVDGSPQLRGMAFRDQALERQGGVGVRVAQVAGPFGEAAAHRLGHHMHGGGGSEAFGCQVIALEDVERLDQHDTAGTRWGHGKDLDPAIRATDGIAPLRLIGFQILAGDQAAVGQHLAFESLRHLALVEATRSPGGDPTQRAREVGLPQHVARLIRLAAFRELGRGGRGTGELRPGIPEGSRQLFRNHKAIVGQRDGRSDETFPGKPALVAPGQVESSDGAGNTD